MRLRLIVNVDHVTSYDIRFLTYDPTTRDYDERLIVDRP